MGAATLIACIARTAWAGGNDASAFITNVEKAKNAPTISAHPSVVPNVASDRSAASSPQAPSKAAAHASRGARTSRSARACCSPDA